MTFEEAVLAVLRDEAPEPVHWTRIQDLALRRGYLDPFTQPDVRRNLLAALGALVRGGSVRRHSKGVYALPAPEDRQGR